MPNLGSNQDFSGHDLSGSVGSVEGGGGQGGGNIPGNTGGFGKVSLPKKKKGLSETLFFPGGDTEEQTLAKAPAPAAAPAAGPAAASGLTARAPDTLQWDNLIGGTAAPMAYRQQEAPVASRKKAAQVIATGYGF